VPGAEDATYDPDKFRRYLLDPTHRTGWGKAKFFQQYGYTQSNWQQLAEQVMTQLPQVSCRSKKVTDYGEQYEAQMVVDTPSGQAVNVTTAWLVEGDYPPKFLTAYPGVATTTTVGELQDEEGNPR
jgi:hypothetical protein